MSEVAISEIDRKKEGLCSGNSIMQNSTINETFLREIIASYLYLKFYEDKVTDDIHHL